MSIYWLWLWRQILSCPHCFPFTSSCKGGIADIVSKWVFRHSLTPERLKEILRKKEGQEADDKQGQNAGEEHNEQGDRGKEDTDRTEGWNSEMSEPCCRNGQELMKCWLFQYITMDNLKKNTSTVMLKSFNIVLSFYRFLQQSLISAMTVAVHTISCNLTSNTVFSRAVGGRVPAVPTLPLTWPALRSLLLGICSAVEQRPWGAHSHIQMHFILYILIVFITDTLKKGR